MALALTLDLQLVERRPDRVIVAVVLAPSGTGPAVVDGVALQLFSRAREALGPRLLLPISGTLGQRLVSTVELRAQRPLLPAGSVVMGTVWAGPVQTEASCPTDPWTELAAHVRGASPIVPRSDAQLLDLEEPERARLVAVFPWLEPPPPADMPALVLDEEEDEAEALDNLCDQLGLDGADAAFLKDLLAEE